MKAPDPLILADNYIMKHFRECPRAEGVARAVGISRSHLCRKYRARFGVSLKERTLTLQMGAAIRMLKTTRKSVKLIAQQAGFASTKTFAAIVLRTYKCSPTEYRNRHGNPREPSK